MPVERPTPTIDTSCPAIACRAVAALVPAALVTVKDIVLPRSPAVPVPVAPLIAKAGCSEPAEPVLRAVAAFGAIVSIRALADAVPVDPLGIPETVIATAPLVLEALAEASVKLIVKRSPEALVAAALPMGSPRGFGSKAFEALMPATPVMLTNRLAASPVAVLVETAAAGKCWPDSVTSPDAVVPATPEGIAFGTPMSAVSADAAAAPGMALERNGAIVFAADIAVEPGAAPPTCAIAAPVAVTPAGAASANPASETVSPAAALVAIALAGFGLTNATSAFADATAATPVTGTDVVAAPAAIPAADVAIALAGLAATVSARLVAVEVAVAVEPASPPTCGTTEPAVQVASAPDGTPVSEV